jgi:hypothetical protein
LPDRSHPGLAALAVCGLVIVAAPVSYRIASTWDGALTWTGMLLACGTVLALGLAWAWAYRHRPIVDAEVVKALMKFMETQRKEIERQQRQLGMEPTWPELPMIVDHTVEADDGR